MGTVRQSPIESNFFPHFLFFSLVLLHMCGCFCLFISLGSSHIRLWMLAFLEECQSTDSIIKTPPSAICSLS